MILVKHTVTLTSEQIREAVASHLKSLGAISENPWSSSSRALGNGEWEFSFHWSDDGSESGPTREKMRAFLLSRDYTERDGLWYMYEKGIMGISIEHAYAGEKHIGR